MMFSLSREPEICPMFKALNDSFERLRLGELQQEMTKAQAQQLLPFLDMMDKLVDKESIAEEDESDTKEPLGCLQGLRVQADSILKLETSE